MLANWSVVNFGGPPATGWLCKASGPPAAVGRDDQALREPVALPAELFPPTTDRSHRELSRVVGNADGDARFIVLDVVDPVRDRLTKLRVRKIMHLDFDRLSFRAVRLA